MGKDFFMDNWFFLGNGFNVIGGGDGDEMNFSPLVGVGNSLVMKINVFGSASMLMMLVFEILQVDLQILTVIGLVYCEIAVSFLFLIFGSS